MRYLRAMLRTRALLFTVLWGLCGCGDDDTTPIDAGTADTGVVDLGGVDLGIDAGPADLGPAELGVDASCPDVDGDGVGAAPCGTDCDDADATRFPGNTELCDADDEDCNDTTVGALDDDGDGVDSDTCCNGATCGEDCDDCAGAVSPLAPEVCNLVDDDCSGVVDDGVTVTLYRDADGDLFGDTAMPADVCAGTAGYAVSPGDCDDGNAMRYPGSPSMPCP